MTQLGLTFWILVIVICDLEFFTETIISSIKLEAAARGIAKLYVLWLAASNPDEWETE
jgi:hypothetical protein